MIKWQWLSGFIARNIVFEAFEFLLILAVNDKSLFVVTKHGGHLGFYEPEEGSSLLTHGVYTWLDKVIVEYVGAVLIVSAAGRSTS